MKKFDAYVEANTERFIEEVKQFCRQPSVSAQGIGLEEMAVLVKARLEKLGAEVQLIMVDDGPPVIYGQIGEGERTLLFYNHYDVVPPEPLELWESDPFEPQMRDGKLYARGIADDKGDLLSRVQAVEAYQATLGDLPIKIKFVFEGKEEVGSPQMVKLAAEYAELLTADGCMWEAGSKDESERPILTLGVKGIIDVELKVHGVKSGIKNSLATIVPNPAWRLVWALSTLKDENDNILIEGLMDHVAEPTVADMEMLAAIPFEEEKMRANFGIPNFIRGLTGIEVLKKHLYEPTCTICGFQSGGTGPGTMTVIPDIATVKLDFRLVPNLGPDLVLELLRKHLNKWGFTEIEVKSLYHGYPARTMLEASIVKAAIAAAEVAYGQSPVVYPLMAGFSPMYPLAQSLGTPAFSAGIGYPGMNIHAPNENIRPGDYFEVIRFVGELIHQFATI